jgi:hypothetical protein
MRDPSVAKWKRNCLWNIDTFSYTPFRDWCFSQASSASPSVLHRLLLTGISCSVNIERSNLFSFITVTLFCFFCPRLVCILATFVTHSWPVRCPGQYGTRTREISPKLSPSLEGPCKLITRINDLVCRIQRYPRAKMMVMQLDREAAYLGAPRDEHSVGRSSSQNPTSTGADYASLPSQPPTLPACGDVAAGLPHMRVVTRTFQKRLPAPGTMLNTLHLGRALSNVSSDLPLHVNTNSGNERRSKELTSETETKECEVSGE